MKCQIQGDKLIHTSIARNVIQKSTILPTHNMNKKMTCFLLKGDYWNLVFVLNFS